MDLSLLVAALSLLVTTIAEIRASLSTTNRNQIREIGLNLYELVTILDRINDTGENIISTYIHIQSADGLSLKQSREVQNLIRQQIDNIEALNTIYRRPFSRAKSTVPITTGGVIEIMIPRETEGRLLLVSGKKRSFLQVVSWKLKETPALPVQAWFVARQVFKLFKDTIKTEAKGNSLSLQFPKKAQVKVMQSIDENGKRLVAKNTDLKPVAETKQYFLGDPRELSLLIDEARANLKELREIREQLAQAIRTHFPFKI